MNGGTMASAMASVEAAGRRTAVLIGAIVVLAILIVFRDTALEIVSIWQRSDTFSYGFLIVPIALWFAWDKRAALASVPVRPFWAGAIPVAGAGFMWLLGSLADAAVVEHFALVLMIQFAVLTVFGLSITWALLFPLAFLFFAVPFGDVFVPKLMDWTADFTVLGLNLTGIPVYREGNSFVIPSGNWSVVEACSGARYLISSVMVGSLFAYLMYRRTWKRILFFAMAIVVPIVANWMRAYLIVMIGHLSGNKLAAGIDHLIYGWIFFGIVIGALFWVGARFREDTASLPISTEVGSARAPSVGRVAAAAVIAVVAAVVWSPVAAFLNNATANGRLALSPIEGAKGWTSLGEPPEGTWKPRFAGQRADRFALFERQGERVVVGVYYYTDQTPGQELITSENVLITTKDPNWREIARGHVDLTVGSAPVQLRTARLTGARGRFDVAWWYWVAGRTTTSDSVAKALLAWSRLRMQGDDSAAVFLFTEPSDRSDGDEVLRHFAADMGARIDQSLGRARGADR